MSIRFDLARVLVQVTSPFRISGAEQRGSPWDATFVVDPNGIPAIPGPSLTGVLRHAFAAAAGEDPADGPKTRQLFGYQEDQTGRSSRVAVSWGHAVGADGNAVSFEPRLADPAGRDPVLELMVQGVLRDHVRLSHRGVADSRAKFDELLVPAGARFLFEIRLDYDEPDGEVPGVDLTRLLELLDAGTTRLGGSSTRGMGAFEIVQYQSWQIDLRKERDRSRLAELPVDLSEPVRHPEPTPWRRRREGDGWVQATLDLLPEGFWLFGGGEPHRDEHLREKRRVERDSQRRVVKWSDFVDRVPVTERRILWPKGDRGRVSEDPEHLVPASSMKGALRHRSEFHFRRRYGGCVSVGSDPTQVSAVTLQQQVETAAGPVPELSGLFGSIKERGGGEAGRLFIEDGWVVSPQYGRQDHVSIDRFTGGPMDGLLFSEASLYRGMLRVTLSVQKHESIGIEARAAFQDALDDLCEGRLAVGAHGARGYGFMENGRVDWDDGGCWIRGES